jgi:hypothetical protein
METFVSAPPASKDPSKDPPASLQEWLDRQLDERGYDTAKRRALDVSRGLGGGLGAGGERPPELQPPLCQRADFMETT